MAYVALGGDGQPPLPISHRPSIIPEDESVVPGDAAAFSAANRNGEAPLKQNQLSFGNLASRLIFTKSYVIVYIVMTMLCLALFLWEVVFSLCLSNSTCLDYDNENRGGGDASHGGSARLFEVLDIAATCMLLIEVLIRIVATRRTFFRSWFNIFDLTILIACCIYAILDYTIDLHPTTELVKAFILFFRYCIQLTRIGLVLKHHTDRRRMIGASQKLDIDFKAVAPTSTKHRSQHHHHVSSSGDVKFSGATIVSPSDGHTPHHQIAISSPSAAGAAAGAAAITPSAAAASANSINNTNNTGGSGGISITQPAVQPILTSTSASGAGDDFERIRAPSTASQFGTGQFGTGNSIALSSTAGGGAGGGGAVSGVDFADDPRFASPPSSFAQITAAVQAKAAGKAARR